jgi:hypothetical protein
MGDGRREADQAEQLQAPAGIRAWLGTIWLTAVLLVVVGFVCLAKAGPCRFGSIAGLERRIELQLPPDAVLVDGCYGHDGPWLAAWAVLRMPASSFWDSVSDVLPCGQVSQEPENWATSHAPRLKGWHPDPDETLLTYSAGYERGSREMSLCLQADPNSDGTVTVSLFWLND